MYDSDTSVKPCIVIDLDQNIIYRSGAMNNFHCISKQLQNHHSQDSQGVTEVNQSKIIIVIMSPISILYFSLTVTFSTTEAWSSAFQCSFLTLTSS